MAVDNGFETEHDDPDTLYVAMSEEALEALTAMLEFTLTRVRIARRDGVAYLQIAVRTLSGDTKYASAAYDDGDDPQTERGSVMIGHTMNRALRRAIYG